MLEEVLERELCPSIEILFVDEAQDLTPLQYTLTQLWSEQTVNTTYAGDSDQAIFRFSGSVPEVFRDLEHGWLKHLDQSYRVPPAVHDYGERIIVQAKNRENTTYKPDSRYTKGKVDVVDQPDLSLPGIHMILCRCNYQIPQWIEFLINQDLMWYNPYRPENLYWNPKRTKSWRAIETFFEIFSGKEVSTVRFQLMVEKMIAKDNIRRGMKKTILEMPDNGRVDLFDLAILGFEDNFVEKGDQRPLLEVFRLTGKIVPLIERLLILKKRNKNIFSAKPNTIVGTVHCSPGDEKISTAWHGDVTIKNLNPHIHKLLSYSKKMNRLMRGHTNAGDGFSFEISNRKYSGELITISTKKSITRVTPDHRIVAKFTDKFIDKYVLYLMRRKNWWRIGICVSARKPYRSAGIGARLATEQAEDGWILGIYNTRKEALIAECKTQTIYGITGLTFEINNKCRKFTTQEVHAVHEDLKNDSNLKVKKIFKDFGLNKNYPLYTRSSPKNDVTKRNLRSAFETIAANLISHYMKIPVPTDNFLNRVPWNNKPDFLPVLIKKNHYQGKVYSLNVHPHQCYISGGAIVHNSVKGGEADYVWFDTSISPKIRDSIDRDKRSAYDEVRVAYVAATRAKQTLGLVRSVQNFSSCWNPLLPKP